MMPHLGSDPDPPIVEKWPFWGYGDLALLIGCFFASFVVVALLLGGATLAFPAVKHNAVALALGFQVVLYGLAYLSLHFTIKSRYGHPVLRSLGWKMPRQGLFIPALAGLALPFAVSVLISPFHPPKIDSPFDKFTVSPELTVCFCIIAAILAPMMEELVFRGFLQPLLSRSLGAVAGILLTALLFGGLHAPEYSYAWQFVAAVTLAGVAFGAMRAWTDSTIASAIMHGGFNMVMVVGIFMRPGHH
jgi:membrane protease YdiL (CAAX protease family)